MAKNIFINRFEETLHFHRNNGVLFVGNFWECSCGRLYRRSADPVCPACGRKNQDHPDCSAEMLVTYGSALLSGNESYVVSMILDS